MRTIENTLAQSLSVPVSSVKSVIALLEDGNTVPFIARYRKDQTGNLSDEILRQLERELNKLKQLEQKREDTIRLINEQGKLDEEVRNKILQASSLHELDDIYRPFRAKRKTRASVAKEAGLLPLAKCIQQAGTSLHDIYRVAESIEASYGFATIEEKIAGGQDILAEALADTPEIRKRLRNILNRNGVLVVDKKREEDSVYRNYYSFQSTLEKLKGYQLLAILRGEKEGFLKVQLADSNYDFPYVLQGYFQDVQDKANLLQNLCEDCWKRLLKPSLETELKNIYLEIAQEEAMQVFAANLRAALLENPLQDYTVLALDPGFRNGCKIAVTNPHGDVLDTGLIYPVEPMKRIEDAHRFLLKLIQKHNVQVLALGNGTATRETEEFVDNFLEEYQLDLPLFIVNEAGASVYSASELASKEFPDMDVSLRSAVSLARRLQDPLAELVKVDPEALGLGQYQHDMNPKELQKRLAEVVEDCVNEVGCDLNTASASLLRHISGISESLAQNIVDYRSEHRTFKNRLELKKVPRLGPKAYEQCAGFLRISGGTELLDDSSIHPESYVAAKAILKRFSIKLKDTSIEELERKIPEEIRPTLAEELAIGQTTLQDILESMAKLGRDPRDTREIPKRNKKVKEIEDLYSGLKLTGVVRNVTQFGAFVDIGVHQDGLVHISEIADQFVSNPSDYFHSGQNVEVLVLEVDVEKKRISLSTKPSLLH